MLVEIPLLSLMIAVPLLGALLVYIGGKKPENARILGVTVSLIPLVISILLLAGFLMPDSVQLRDYRYSPTSQFHYRAYESAEWIPGLGVTYALGVDELSITLVFLAALLTTLAMIFSWDEKHRVREFYAMFLFMEATIVGVFISLDFFLFFIFWEAGLIPMYFIIAVWGGPRKKYASMKFFLYTQAASLLVLLAIFVFYLYGGTSNMVQLIETTPVPAGAVANLLFVGLVIGFGTKLPTWPLHTWLPDAHVEAPTAGSVLLAGILLKLGGYGLIRVNVQMLPSAAIDMVWLLAGLGTVSIIYGAIVCIAQDDIKRMVAFSSVSHMGFVTLGIAAGVFAASKNPGAGNLAFSGAIFQMFAHGLVSAMLFMVAGSIGHKIGTRNISDLGGIAAKTPRLSTFIMISFLASLGLPGLVGFVAEFTVFVGTYEAFGWFVAIPIITVVLTAAYYIYAMQKALFGPLNPKLADMPDAHAYEEVPLGVLTVLLALFGILPFLFFNLIGNFSGPLLGLIGGH